LNSIYRSKIKKFLNQESKCYSCRKPNVIHGPNYA